MNVEQFGPARFRSDLGIPTPVIPAPVDVYIAPEPEGGNKSLTTLQFQTLFLYAWGLDMGSIALLFERSVQTVKKNTAAIREKLDCISTRGAIVKVVNLGELDPQYLVPEDFDPSILNTLGIGERDVLVHSVGDKSQEEIARDLRTSVRTVRNRAKKIIAKTDSGSTTRAVVLYLEARQRKQEEAKAQGLLIVYVFGPLPESSRDLGVVSKRELEVLELNSQGLTDKQIGEKLGIKVGVVKNHLWSARSKLRGQAPI